MVWRYTLTDTTFGTPVTQVVDEPEGWNGAKFIFKRDTDKHGVFFDFTLGDLGFHGAGYELIKDAWDEKGIFATTTLLIEIQCGNDYDEFYEGKLNYAKIKFSKGDPCRVTVGIEQTGCLMTFRNRYDQKVNLSSLVGFDGTTELEEYEGLGFEQTLPAKDILRASEASTTAGYTLTYTDQISRATLVTANYFFSFEFGDLGVDDLHLNNFECIGDGISSDMSFADYTGLCPGLLAPPFDLILCEEQDYDIHVRLKGTITDTSLDTRTFDYNIILRAGTEENGYTDLNIDLLPGSSPIGNPKVIPFDITYDTTVTLQSGVSRLYLVFALLNYNYTSGTFNFPFDLTIEFEIGEFTASTLSECAPTDAKVFLINEALSRTSEIITDDCMRVYSEYFGRTDSQPYQTDDNGCGSNELITNGLLIRRALLNDGSVPNFTVSFKHLFESLNAIHCIGLGMEEDDQRSAGFMRFRVEPTEYFYQNTLGLTCTDVKTIVIRCDEKRLYSTIEVGYKKWEPDEIGGRDDFHSKRTYRTEQDAITNALNIQSDFIASNYSAEITRRQGTGTKDWKYDNDTFIYCFDRTVYGTIDIQGDFIPNQAANIIAFSPYYFNQRITPVRNLLHWFKILSATWSKEFLTEVRALRFTSGEGNYIAGWLKTDVDDCILETTTPLEFGDLYENQDVDKTTFKNYDDCKPLWEPEIIEFEYPMTYQQFRSMRLNPYRLVKATQGANEYFGWIMNLEYDPNEGMGKFELIRQYTDNY